MHEGNLLNKTNESMQSIDGVYVQNYYINVYRGKRSTQWHKNNNINVKLFEV